jgi:hypothetical protein
MEWSGSIPKTSPREWRSGWDLTTRNIAMFMTDQICGLRVISVNSSISERYKEILECSLSIILEFCFDICSRECGWLIRELLFEMVDFHSNRDFFFSTCREFRNSTNVHENRKVVFSLVIYVSFAFRGIEHGSRILYWQPKLVFRTRPLLGISRTG